VKVLFLSKVCMSDYLGLRKHPALAVAKATVAGGNCFSFKADSPLTTAKRALLQAV
jgi:hypothetical protein